MPIILISSCAVFIASLFLSQSQIIANINYNLHESFVIPIYICVFLIPLEVLYLVIKWIDCCIHKNKSAKSNSALNLLSIVSFLICVGIATFFFNSVTTEGCYNSVEKCMIHNNYYIKTDNILMKIDKNDYYRTKSGKDYQIEYKWNKLIPNQYRITKITEIR